MSDQSEVTLATVQQRLDRVIVLLEKLVQAHSHEIAEYQKKHGSPFLSYGEMRALIRKAEEEGE